MNQMCMGIMLVLGLATFSLYNQNQTLTANNLALEGAVAAQQAAMTAMKESFEKQGKSLKQMMQKNTQEYLADGAGRVITKSNALTKD